ncbi:uncharacterized protein LACBIDRAFT_333361 [Laccaria bicolor S238N-H82]|uniref:Predicted protein n=1 Tax=Laccaria bicolor (strain S238N-H82 / ATCC MYA-4686) TaxID=486041 RepID=B0DVN8_LACBS|nr:uncharacterized protein LACBIDRAFT_333361 [Laccaria bicolor S238N-H82]EDR01334.1 predicted protein [Laccaria bicolor S238N-H82]|eukprot:XP_001888041.1 predicted protein [Laccaria bicolor S238N-H82]
MLGKASDIHRKICCISKQKNICSAYPQSARKSSGSVKTSTWAGENVAELTRSRVLELDLHEQFYGTANIDNFLTSANLPKLRILRFRGVNCHDARSCLDADGAPVSCRRSAQPAAEILKAPRPTLETLLGVEVHDTIVDSNYFTWDDDWEEEDHDDYDEDKERASPWKAIFLENLMTQRPVRRFRVPSVNSAQEIEHLSVVAPQITELRDIVTTGQNPEIPVKE